MAPEQQQQPQNLHFFLLPFPVPSHTMAMLHMAVLFSRHGARSTVVTTPSGATSILSTNIIDPFDPLIDVAILSPPEEYHALTAGIHDVAEFSTPNVPDSFISAIETLRSPFELLLRSRRPDCLVSDFFMHWSVDSASLLGIPRLAFGGNSMFFKIAGGSLVRYLASLPIEEDMFILPDLPHRIQYKRSDIPSFFFDPHLTEKFITANKKTHSTIVNSFFDLELDYAVFPYVNKCWLVGPLFMYSKSNQARDDDIHSWLDTKGDGSVVYVCFGSLGRFTPAQTREIAVALRSFKRPFIWVIRKEQEEWLPEKFKEENEEGMVVATWVPQMMILNHRAVGVFVSHCGWNSTLEAMSAGVPMVTWPLFADQPFNAVEVVQVMGTGVAVEGVRCADREEERGLVGSEQIARAVERVMDGGEEGKAARRRARELKEKARTAVEVGGSSHREVQSLFKEMAELKKKREGSNANSGVGA